MENKTVKKMSVYYAKPASDVFKSYMFGDITPNKAQFQSDYVHLMDIDAMDLGDAYEQMQGENWSPNGEARELIRFKGLKHTSMSVGDIIQVGSQYFIVRDIGFDEVDLEE